MTVIVTTGNIFEVEADVITDANNSIGISGGGLALAFAKRYPKLAALYNENCKIIQQDLKNERKKPALIEPVIFPKHFMDNDDYAVCKFPTMIFPGSAAREEHIEANLDNLFKLLNNGHDWYKSIALPALGCGIGRYPFEKLEKQVKEKFDNGPITVYLFKPA